MSGHNCWQFNNVLCLSTVLRVLASDDMHAIHFLLKNSGFLVLLDLPGGLGRTSIGPAT